MKPCYKDYLWGGSELKRNYNKTDAPPVCAESWELSSNKDGCCVVAEGEYEGRSIAELAGIDHDGILGRGVIGDAVPIIVKLIDAHSNLSIQIHPSTYNAIAELGESAKAEMWYIVDCIPNSRIYYGFSRQTDREEFIERALDGTVSEILNSVTVAKGDVFQILPGTIHAIGAGIVLAEIQQNSNTTFRVYDYMRRDSNGKTRPLHIKRAADVADFKPIIPEQCRVNNKVSTEDFVLSEMFSCGFFTAYKIDVYRKIILECNGETFKHLLCIDGEGVIERNGAEYSVSKGSSYFIPAKAGKFSVRGKCRVLLTRI